MDENGKTNTGLRLLRRGRRGLLRAVFSRAGLIFLLLLVQVAVILLLFVRLREYLPHAVTVSAVFSAVMALYLLNSGQDPSAKLTWIVVIMVLPTFGALLYLYTRSDLGHRLLKERFLRVSNRTRQAAEQDPETLERFMQAAPEAQGLLNYVNQTGCFPVYDGCRLHYYPSGDELFPAMLEELEKAEKFIFLEFFIVDEGIMWGRILEILARKARQGVDVRLIYDGSNEFFTLPRNYPRRLEALGIRCRVFAPIAPFVSTHYNYRDHRKMLIVDGRAAFTGGVNLADEYINQRPRFGHWKDAALMMEGPAARSFTLMFLQMWCVTDREAEPVPELEPFLSAPAPRFEEEGFVLPYGDCPLDEERVGELVYMDLLNRARDYVYVMTPYLILDGELETALEFAAMRGVDVRLILPGVPDKKLAWSLAKTHYRALLRAGVKLYEYTPGFVHAKVFLLDDREAVVGTINLDYRSLYHHFECAVWVRDAACLDEIRRDFAQSLALCRPVSAETLRRERWTLKLLGIFAKIIAPLM